MLQIRHLTLATFLAVPVSAIATETKPCASSFVPADPGFEFYKSEPADMPASHTPLQIRQIHFSRLPIFDELNERENNLLYRWANRFHVITRTDTLSKQLLFVEGDQANERIFRESERILRATRYIYDARIRPVLPCGDQVDIEVVTRDVWTITPDLSISRAGGESDFKLGITDNNLFGTGHRTNLAYRQENNRTSYDIAYKAENIGRTRIGLRSRLTDSDDGSEQKFSLFLPFYALDSRRSWRLEANYLNQIDTQYFRDRKVSEVQHDVQLLDAQIGMSRGLHNSIARRYIIGYRYEVHEFSQGLELPAPALFPDDRNLSYPYFQYEYVEDNYTTEFDLDNIHRTEDLHVGSRLNASIGYSGNSEPQRLILTGQYSSTLKYNRDSLLTHAVSWNGYWNFDTDDAENFSTSYKIRYFRRITDRRSFFAKFNAIYTRNLSSERQVLMGGRTGLRGYPNNYQVGDRRYLVTLEQRYYTDYHFLNLVRLGWAVFFDAGRAWFNDRDNGNNGDILSNLGLGLRLVPSKSNLGQVIHLDLAFPLKEADDVNNVEFVISIKDTF